MLLWFIVREIADDKASARLEHARHFRPGEQPSLARPQASATAPPPHNAFVGFGVLKYRRG